MTSAIDLPHALWGRVFDVLKNRQDRINMLQVCRAWLESPDFSCHIGRFEMRGSLTSDIMPPGAVISRLDIVLPIPDDVSQSLLHRRLIDVTDVRVYGDSRDLPDEMASRLLFDIARMFPALRKLCLPVPGDLRPLTRLTQLEELRLFQPDAESNDIDPPETQPESLWTDTMKQFLSRAPNMRVLCVPTMGCTTDLRSDTVCQLEFGVNVGLLGDVQRIRPSFPALQCIYIHTLWSLECLDAINIEEHLRVQEMSPRLRRDPGPDFRSGSVRLPSHITYVGWCASDTVRRIIRNYVPEDMLDSDAVALGALMSQGMSPAAGSVRSLSLKDVDFTDEMVNLLVRSFVSVRTMHICSTSSADPHLDRNMKFATAVGRLAIEMPSLCELVVDHCETSVVDVFTFQSNLHFVKDIRNSQITRPNGLRLKVQCR